MKTFDRFFKYMNPSVDPKVTEDMDRRSLRSIHVISWIVLFLELAAFIIFLFTRSGNYDHEAFVSMASVCFSISMCALASFLSERMLRKEQLPHSAFFIFKIAAFIVFSVTAAFFDIRNYKAGEEIMTFFIVNLVMVCFVLFRPWIGAILIGGSFVALYIPLYIFDGAAKIEFLNFVIFALASVASNVIRFHAQIDISSKTIQMAETNAALEQASRRDGLTGLQNRLALEEDASGMDGRILTAYMIDINYFKEINDRYGHVAGDAILREVSETLKRLFPGGHYYRYGGDEFLVLTHKLPEDNYGSDTYDFKQKQYGVDVLLSIGNAQGSPENYQELYDLIAKADKALYITKRRTHSAEFGGHDRRKPRN